MPGRVRLKSRRAARPRALAVPRRFCYLSAHLMSAEVSHRPRATDCACPFCGLGCDDLALSAAADGSLSTTVDCALARKRYAEQQVAASARIAGEDATFEAALAAAARHVAAAHRLLVTGLGVDVSGMRAAVRFARARDALLDHRAGHGPRANQRVFQRRGGISTTYSEARNHGDCFLLVGTDAVSANPRIVERVLAPREALFAPVASRVALHLGPCDETLAAKLAPLALAAQVEAGPGDLLAALTAIGGALRDRQPVSDALAPVVAALRAARYAVVIWDAASLPPGQAELVVEAIADLVAAANLATRCAGLPLRRESTYTNANQAVTWLTGFALPVLFAGGEARHDPVRHDAERWLAQGTADVVLSLDAWAGMSRTQARGARHVVVAPRLAPGEEEPDVFIPVAIPGRDSAGHLFRGDGVVSLHLRPMLPSGVPSVAAVLEAIASRLPSPISA
jgi:formylmethanofuran dehydrogenase subunit B